MTPTTREAGLQNFRASAQNLLISLKMLLLHLPGRIASPLLQTCHAVDDAWHTFVTLPMRAQNFHELARFMPRYPLAIAWDPVALTGKTSSQAALPDPCGTLLSG